MGKNKDRLSYTPSKGVLFSGFNDLNDKDLDKLSDIAHVKDMDNKRAFRKKKKMTKPKTKRKSCGCK